MESFELGITPSYIPNWGIWEACREAIQNAKDAEQLLNADTEITYDPLLKTLAIINKEVSLPRKVWLLGYTTKQESKKTIGQWGEGLKLACLAGVRAGLDIIIENNSEIWKPIIRYSKAYDGEVLAINIEKSQAPHRNFKFIIQGLSEREWEKVHKRILFLKEPNPIAKDFSTYGQILPDHERSGDIYCKGIWVTKVDKLQYSYNINNLKLSRDRQMVDIYALQASTAHIVENTFGHHPKLTEEIFQTLINKDTENLPQDFIALRQWPQKAFSKEFSDRFQQEFPEHVVCNSPDQKNQVLSIGRKPVVVSTTVMCLLKAVEYKNTYSSMIKNNPVPIKKTYSIMELSSKERMVFYDSLSIVMEAMEKIDKKTSKLKFLIPKVVDFQDKQIYGMWRKQKGEESIEIARTCLKSLPFTIRTMVHEESHQTGLDYSRNHIQTVELLYQNILKWALKNEDKESKSRNESSSREVPKPREETREE